MAFLGVLAFIILFVSHLSLKNRVSQLESILKAKNQFRSVKPDQQTTPEPVPTEASNFEPDSRPNTEWNTDQLLKPIPHNSQVVNQTFTPSTDSPEGSPFFLYDWFKEQTLIKVGAIIFFLGAVWFVSYAIDQNWLSPAFRILLGVLGSVILYGIGYLKNKTSVTQYQTLTVLGSGVLLGTIAASQFSFSEPVISATFALILMTAGIAYTALVALATKTEWLAITAVVAGLMAPLLIKVESPDAFLLLSYLFCVSLGFLLISAVANWKHVAIVLVSGISLYTIELYANTSDLLLWVFVCLFSALFTASVANAIARTGQPQTIDVVTITLTLFLFLISATEVAFSTALAQFVAALVAAGIAYWFKEKRAHSNSIALFSVLSITLIFVATSSLFSGTTLTIVFAIEALVLLIGCSYVTQSQRAIYATASTFLIPVLSALNDLILVDWDQGLLNISLFSIIVMTISLAVAIVWLIEQPILKMLTWVRSVAGLLLSLWFIYVWSAMSSIASAFNEPNSTVILSILSTAVALIACIYVGLRVPNITWRSLILLAWLPPLISIFGALSHPVWNTGLSHSTFVATVIFSLALVCLTLFYTYVSRRERVQEQDSINAYITLWLNLGFVFFWLNTVWHAIYPSQIASIVQYVSYFIVICLVIHLMMLIRVRFSWIIGVLSLGVLPLLMSLMSFDLSGWSAGWRGLDAVGLYASTTLILLTATTLNNYPGLPGERENITNTRKVLFWFGGIQVFILIWIITHTLASTAPIAVTAALFIYTVAGLSAYSYGRAKQHQAIRYVGVLLLGAVVLRLGLIDVWTMEVFWRIITFLGIGTLFMATALLERSPDKPPQASEDK